MHDVFRLGFILMAICAVAAAALAYVNDITEEKIAYQRQLEQERALERVLPGCEEFKDETEKIGAYIPEGQGEKDFGIVQGAYVGYSKGRPSGLAVRVAPTGYGGPVEMMVGISSEGIVKGLVILGQQETPGLGAKIASPEFGKRFEGKRVGGRVRVEKDGGDVQAITGATISSRAVARGVDVALRLFEAVSKKGLSEVRSQKEGVVP